MYKKQKERKQFLEKWNKVLDKLLENHVFPEEYTRFENEMVTSNFICRMDGIQNAVGFWLNSLDEQNLNSAEMSNKYREEGNELFRANKVENSYSAQNNYTKALFGAPDKKHAALCHANRAAALIQIGFYEEAYDDCSCAIELGYPSENLEKIYARQATCAIALKDSKKLKICLDKLHKSKVFGKEIEKLNKKLEELQNELPKNDQVKGKLSQDKLQKILHSTEKGTYVVADEPILQNEMILSEKAFAFVPIYGNNLQIIDVNCQNCGEVNIIPFPCYKCSKVCYCSSKCRILHETIHQFECNGIKKLLFFEIGIGHLALRTFLVGFPILIEYILKITSKKSLNLVEMWSKVLKFAEDDKSQYAGVMKLITNFDKMDIKDYLRYTLTGLMLTVYLHTQTRFFKKYISKECYKIMPNKLDWQILISALITRHIGQMICNAHTISGLRLSVDKRLNIFKSKYRLLMGKLRYYFEVATFYAAIYPRVSLFNHSCQPNIRNHFNQINLNIIATNNMTKGEEILNCYGKNYKLTSKFKRLTELKAQYHFICKCSHCSNKDDTEFERFHSLKCNRKNCNNIFYPENLIEHWWDEDIFERNFKIVCPKCTNPLNFKWYIEYSDILKHLMFNSNGNLSTLERLCELYNYGKTILVDAHPMKLNMIMMAIEHANIGLTGENIKINKKIYGKFIEMGIDWLKFTEQLYGLYDLEYVSVSTFVLDLLVAIKYHGTIMRFNYDLNKIKKTFEILSDNTKLIFDNYFDDYVSDMI